ncbi:hypothetical protein [Carboxylicivirga sp. M1479]|uniref:hypothetical protein n=1 Tax=Carboxylicivirga sp. M1479 TaxID=2594476 RepID=UPI00117738E4|nr:hypothetical protein [Carboxylicivirga sp. M1479]TRX63988.1 hypothetical protein FNN09_18260 [Carboxylicivirga sp. M1479]
MNIKFGYLYRDEGNYKTFGEVVFSNPKHLPFKFIKQSIESNLIEGMWFEPDKWNVPRFIFHVHNPFGIHDYLWYEFDCLSQCDETPNSNSIDEFLKRINS